MMMLFATALPVFGICLWLGSEEWGLPSDSCLLFDGQPCSLVDTDGPNASFQSHAKYCLPLYIRRGRQDGYWEKITSLNAY